MSLYTNYILQVGTNSEYLESVSYLNAPHHEESFGSSDWIYLPLLYHKVSRLEWGSSGIFTSGLIFLNLTFSNGDTISLVLSLDCFLKGVGLNVLHAPGCVFLIRLLVFVNLLQSHLSSKFSKAIGFVTQSTVFDLVSIFHIF